MTRGPYLDAVKEMSQVRMTCHIRRQREAKFRTRLGFLLLALIRKVTGWQMQITFLSPGDEVDRPARRRADRRNKRIL